MPNKPVCRVILLIALALASGATGMVAQSSRGSLLVVTVLDDQSGMPIEGAHVTIDGATRTARGVFTDGAGVARLGGVPAGNHILTVGMLGYETARAVLLQLTDGGSVEAEVRLTLQPIALAGITATGDRRDPYLLREGFYSRAHFEGTFLYGAEFERRAQQASALHQLFRMIRGFWVLPRGTGWTLQSSRGTMASHECTPLILLDGSPVYGGASDLDQIVDPFNVAAIEAYAGPAESPMEFGVSSCGMVLIWTRHGR